jgi:hypothetical protein
MLQLDKHEGADIFTAKARNFEAQRVTRRWDTSRRKPSINIFLATKIHPGITGLVQIADLVFISLA